MSSWKDRLCDCGCGESFTPKRHRPDRPAYVNEKHKRAARKEREQETRNEAERCQLEDARLELLAYKVAGEWTPELETQLEEAREAHRSRHRVNSPDDQPTSTDPYLTSPDKDPWHRRRLAKEREELPSYDRRLSREMEKDSHGRPLGSRRRKARRESYEEIARGGFTRWRYSDEQRARFLALADDLPSRTDPEQDEADFTFHWNRGGPLRLDLQHPPARVVALPDIRPAEPALAA